MPSFPRFDKSVKNEKLIHEYDDRYPSEKKQLKSKRSFDETTSILYLSSYHCKSSDEIRAIVTPVVATAMRHYHRKKKKRRRRNKMKSKSLMLMLLPIEDVLK